MRLICPNCGAQYEVPDGVIPDQGRDVQCSNCGNTWFQPHPDHDADLAEELGKEIAPPAPKVDAPQPKPNPEPEPEVVAEREPTPPQERPQPARRELDPAIADLLREEAEYEARQRAAEAEADMQTQPDLGLEEPGTDETARRAEEARQRMERRKGPQPDPEPDLPDEDDLSEHVGSRRELLPDIEEINSSLNAEGRKPAQSDDYASPGGDTAAVPRKSSGFSGGFILGVLVIALLWSVHVFSAQISEQLPQLAGPLESYSRSIDSGRGWLDTQVKALLVKLDELAAASEA